VRVRAWHGAVAALGVVVGLIVLAYVRGPGEPSAVPSPSLTTPAPEPSPTALPVARIADLVPAEPAPNEWEDSEAVQTIRERSAAFAWSALTDTREFAQYQDLLEVSGMVSVNGFVGTTSALIGPAAYTPLSVAELDDGTTVVDVCSLFTARLTVDRRVGEPGLPGHERQYHLRYLLSPLTEEERLLLGDRADDYTSLRIREIEQVEDDYGMAATCPEVPIVVQEFEDWQDHLGQVQH
jgi:hypothetical protein